MTSVNIRMPVGLRKKAEARAAEGGHASVEAYVQALVRADADPVSLGPSPAGPRHLVPRGRQDLEAKLLAGIGSGPAVEMSAEDWAGIQREVAGRVAAAHPATSPTESGRRVLEWL